MLGAQQAAKGRPQRRRKLPPLSEVMAAGTPKRATQPRNRARAQSAADVAASGTASAHRVVRSMMVKRYVQPPELGSGPTRSTWMWLNRRPGTGMWRGLRCTCLMILPRWQVRHARVHAVMLAAAPLHTNLERIIRLVARIPGWEMLCIFSKISC